MTDNEDFRITTVFECWLIVREETERVQNDMLTVSDLGLFYRLQRVRDTLDDIARRFVKGPSPLPLPETSADRLQMGDVFDLADTELRLLCDCLGRTMLAFTEWAKSDNAIVAHHYMEKADACRALLSKLRQALENGALDN